MGVEGHPRDETGVFLGEDGPERPDRGAEDEVCVCVCAHACWGQLQRCSWHITGVQNVLWLFGVVVTVTTLPKGHII